VTGLGAGSGTMVTRCASRRRSPNARPGRPVRAA